MSRDPNPPRDCSVFRQGAGVSRAQMVAAAKFPSLWNIQLRRIDGQTLLKSRHFAAIRETRIVNQTVEFRLKKNSILKSQILESDTQPVSLLLACMSYIS